MGKIFYSDESQNTIYTFNHDKQAYDLKELTVL